MLAQSLHKSCKASEKFAHSVIRRRKSLHNRSKHSLHMNCQSWWKCIHRRCEICKASLHILSKIDRKVYTEQISVNLCKLSPKFTQACPQMKSVGWIAASYRIIAERNTPLGLDAQTWATASQCLLLDVPVFHRQFYGNMMSQVHNPTTHWQFT